MVRCAILQSSYIPWKGYFDLISSVDQFILYDCVQFTKNDWRNRNKIKAAGGVQWITIPIAAPSLSAKIDEVQVSDPNWARRHWRTLTQNYSKCKYFSHYRDRLELFYLYTEERSLSKINTELIQIICEILGIRTKITHSTEYVLHDDRILRLVNLCKQVGATTYLSGPAAKAYLDESKFVEENISVEWMDYSGYPEYQQRFPPFEHGVSVLDLLFNEGPHAADYLQRNKAIVNP